MSAADVGYFFERPGRRLYGFSHAPRRPLKSTACVLVHPFMEERQDAHAVLRDLAEAMAEQGHPSLRFDLYGCGDSAGEWSDATIEGWRDDVVGAVEHARATTGLRSVVLIGLRFGATLAALSAAAAGASAVAMLQPIVRGETYLRELLLASVAAEMVLHRKVGTTRERLLEDLRAGLPVKLFGYDLTPAQYRSMMEIDLLRDAVPAGPSLVLDVVRSSTGQGSAEVRAYAQALAPSATSARAVEPATLYAEGKIRLARAEGLRQALLPWLESLE